MLAVALANPRDVDLVLCVSSDSSSCAVPVFPATLTASPFIAHPGQSIVYTVRVEHVSG